MKIFLRSIFLLVVMMLSIHSISDAFETRRPTIVLNKLENNGATIEYDCDSDAWVSNKQVVYPGDHATLNIIFDGGGSVLTAGTYDSVLIPHDYLITGWYLLAGQTGSIQIDIWKGTYTDHPLADADSITASTEPSIASSNKSMDTVLTGWSTSLSSNDILCFNIDSVTSIINCTLVLELEKQ